MIAITSWGAAAGVFAAPGVVGETGAVGSFVGVVGGPTGSVGPVGGSGITGGFGGSVLNHPHPSTLVSNNAIMTVDTVRMDDFLYIQSIAEGPLRQWD